MFKTKDITAFYRSYDPELKKSTINWRSHHLVQKGILKRIGKGIFKLGQQKEFQPEISSKLRTIVELIQSRFPYSEYCVWDTAIINQFMVHQPLHFIDMVEVDNDSTSTVFNMLKEEGYQVFIKPDKEIMSQYLVDAKEPIIIKPLITEAPVQKLEGISTVTLEKLLVDLFTDNVIFNVYQGKELSTIFKEVFSSYTVNIKKLLRYADRRKQRAKIADYLERQELLLIKEERSVL